nr:SUMF1/EgtB/PvdO family nonheme iron enzyme [Rhodoferax sp.]
MNYYRLSTLLVAVLALPLAHAQPGYDVPIPPPKPPQLTAKPVSAPAPIEAEKQAKQQGAAQAAKVKELESKLTAARVLVPGQVIQDCPYCPKMVVIPAGTFTMGSPDSEAGRSGDEGPQHSARVEKFLLGQTEVTVAQFRRFVQAKNYKTEAERNVGESGCFGVDLGDGKADWRSGRSWRSPGWDIADNEPVTCVSWNDANAYVAWLSELTKQPYQLPTEAQWEYAARAGTSTSRYWGEDLKQACLYDNVSNVVAHAGGGLSSSLKRFATTAFASWHL